MTNEKFQEIVLSELRDLKEGQKRLEKGQGSLEESYSKLEDSYNRLDERQTRFEKKLNIVYDQTVLLSECYMDLNKKFDILHNDFKSIHQIIGEHEISIRTLRRKDFENNKEFYDAKIREKFPIDGLK